MKMKRSAICFGKYFVKMKQWNLKYENTLVSMPVQEIDLR